MEFTLASMVYVFQITTPTSEHVDMTKSFVKFSSLRSRKPPEFYEGPATEETFVQAYWADEE